MRWGLAARRHSIGLTACFDRGETPYGTIFARRGTRQFGEHPELVVKITMDCQAFENIKLSLNAALDIGKDLAQTRLKRRASKGTAVLSLKTFS
jgi:hypothetical protein